MPTAVVLQKGDRVPHFCVTRTDGTSFDYESIWQHRNLLLISTGDAEASDVSKTVAGLREREEELAALETTCVITSDAVPGVPTPGIVIADRWGEIQAVADAASWMTIDDVFDWLRFVLYKCPECEGEAK